MKAVPVHPAHWSLPARAALLLLTALACSTSGLALYLRPCAAKRDAAQAQLQALQARVRPALVRAAQLPALRVRHGQLAMRATAQAQQLWSLQELPRLRDKLNHRANECGLVLASFRPLANANATSASAELSLGGNYTAMRCFVTRSSRPPWPVLFDDIDIAPRETVDSDDSAAALLLQASVHAELASPPGEKP